jgi:DNA-binding MarR family transcriptional regulator
MRTRSRRLKPIVGRSPGPAFVAKPRAPPAGRDRVKRWSRRTLAWSVEPPRGGVGAKTAVGGLQQSVTHLASTTSRSRRPRPVRPRPLPRALAEHTSYSLSAAGRAVTRRLEQALDPLGLGVREFGALATLVAIGPLSQQTVASKLGIDRTTAGEVVTDLELEGYVDRRRNPYDLRRWALRATPDGRHLLELATDAVVDAERDHFARLSKTELARLQGLLDAIAPRERNFWDGL